MWGFIMNKEARRKLTIEKYGKKVKYWTEKEIELLKKLFPYHVTEELCDIFKRSKTSIYNKAKRLGLQKSDEFLLKYCGYDSSKQKQIEEKISGKHHWNYGNKRSEEVRRKIKEAHFKLPIEHQKYYSLVGIGFGEVEFKEALEKFNIQHEHQKIFFGKYLVDFYLPEYNLVIEIDGIHHKWQRTRKKDKTRDFELNSAGIEVMRVSSELAINNPDQIVYQIREQKLSYCQV